MSAGSDGEQVDIGAGSGPPPPASSGGAPPASSGGSGAGDGCTYTDLGRDPSIAGGTVGSGAATINPRRDAVADMQAKQGQPGWENGTMMMVECPGQHPTGYYSIPGEPASTPALPELAAHAAASITLTTPPVNFNPYWLLDDGRHATLKNAETWIWIDTAHWSSYTPRVEAGAAWVEAHITPVDITITPNDELTKPATCHGPGTPITPGVPMTEPSPTCSLRFARHTDGNTWPVTIHVTYTVTWSGYDGTTTLSGTLQNVTSTPATYPLAVVRTKPRLVDPHTD